MNDNEKVQQHISNRFQIIKIIGSGAYGIVWKVVDKFNNKPYALKKNFDAFQNATDAQRTYREIMYLRRFKHPNIVNPIQVLRSMNKKDIYILFQYMNIDLYTLLRQNLLGEQHKKYIVYQIAKALYYLHTAELIHRDIKPSNILVNQDCLAKICDFGLIRSVEEDTELPPILTQYIATRWYRAPEILLGSHKYAEPADVWSFGCMLGEIISGKPMFPGTSTLNQIERVVTWTGPPSINDLKSLKTDFGKQMLDLLTKIKPKSRKEWFSNCDPQAMELISQMLNFNPEKRPTMLAVLKHPYIKDYYHKLEIIQSKEPITIEKTDNKKLSLHDYRNQIYRIVEEYENKNQQKMSESQNFVQKKENKLQSEIYSKTLYKPRAGKHLTRSSSKNKDDSLLKYHGKEQSNINIKKKYEIVFGKLRQDLKTKYMRTQKVQQKQKIYPKRKKSDNTVKYYTADKAKKSYSVYSNKRQTQTLAKYIYQNKKI